MCCTSGKKHGHNSAAGLARVVCPERVSADPRLDPKVISGVRAASKRLRLGFQKYPFLSLPENENPGRPSCVILARWLVRANRLWPLSGLNDLLVPVLRRNLTGHLSITPMTACSTWDRGGLYPADRRFQPTVVMLATQP